VTDPFEARQRVRLEHVEVRSGPCSLSPLDTG
jgi:hypothetical protein